MFKHFYARMSLRYIIWDWAVEKTGKKVEKKSRLKLGKKLEWKSRKKVAKKVGRKFENKVVVKI